MNKVRVSVVSYINTYPFLYGLENSDIFHDIELSLDYPSECADKLLKGDVDVGLVPVAVLKDLENYEVITDFCISSKGKVRTVILVSNAPINEVNTIYLNGQSRTSNWLVKILADKYWNINPEFTFPTNSQKNLVYDHSSALYIGDDAFHYENKFKYVYDLSEEWKKHTGLPFVFACWVSNKKLHKEFISKFSAALNFGINNISCIIEENYRKLASIKSAQSYLTSNINYRFDDEKKEAMNLFLNQIKEVLI